MDSKVVGLVADPDLPTDIANRLAGQLPRVLAEEVSGEVDWDIRVQTKALPLDESGNIELRQHSDTIKADESYDYLVYLTELTRHLGVISLSPTSIPPAGRH